MIDAAPVPPSRTTVTHEARLARCVSTSLALTIAACTHSSAPLPPTGEIVVDDVAASGLAIDTTNLYWTTLDGAVMKMPLDGSSDAIALASGIPTRPTSLAVDAEFVYWTNIGSLMSATDGGVMKVPIGGGMSVALATGYQAHVIAIDASSVYWADNGAVHSTPKSGGAVTTIFNNGGFLNEVDGVAIDASFVYWNANGPYKQPLAGGTPTAWQSSVPQGPGNIAVDSTNVYWNVGPFPCDVKPCGANHQGYVMTAPLGGAASTTLAKFTTPSYPVTPMAVDATHVYWMTADSVQRIALDGSGAVETLAEHQGDPYALVLSDTKVFWASGAIGEWPAAIRVVDK